MVDLLKNARLIMLKAELLLGLHVSFSNGAMIWRSEAINALPSGNGSLEMVVLAVAMREVRVVLQPGV